MTIQKIRNEGTLTLVLEGWLNAATSPELNKVIDTELDGVTDLIIDFGKVDYITSAGLRILLIARRVMGAKGNFSVCNVNEEVMEVLEMTGFTDILTIK